MSDQVSNAGIADYLEGVADLYSKSVSVPMRRSSVIYENAASVVRGIRMRLYDASIEELKNIKGIGDAVANAIYNFARDLSEPDAIKKARASGQYSPGPNEALADYILDVSTKATPKLTSDAYKAASVVIRGYNKEISSAEQAKTLRGVGTATGKLIDEYFKRGRSSVLAPSSDLLPIPEITAESERIIQESGETTVLGALTLNIDRIDKHLLYWRDHLAMPVDDDDLDEIEKVFETITKLRTTIGLSEDSVTVLVRLREGSVSDALYSLSPFIRKVIYDETEDTTVLFQASSGSYVRLVRITGSGR